MYIAPHVFSARTMPYPSVRRTQQPAFAGKYSEKAIYDVLQKRYEVSHTFLRYGSEYSFTGLEILERLNEACQERPTRRNGATHLRNIAAHPFIERDAYSIQALEEGLQDLCAIGFAEQVRPREYLITPAGLNYLYPPEDNITEETAHPGQTA
jgi:hypothetical protein